MKYQFVCEQRCLFELSSRVSAPPLSRGELVTHQDKHYQIVDIEHVTVPDGGVDRVRLETQVYLRALGSEELEKRRESQRGRAQVQTPLRY